MRASQFDELCGLRQMAVSWSNERYLLNEKHQMCVKYITNIETEDIRIFKFVSPCIELTGKMTMSRG